MLAVNPRRARFTILVTRFFVQNFAEFFLDTHTHAERLLQSYGACAEG